MKLDVTQFDGVAWDFDGTLADTYHVHDTTRHEVFQKHGFSHITLADQQKGHLYGSTLKEIIAGVLKASGDLPQDADPNTDPLVAKMAVDKDALHILAASKGFDAFPGAIEIVQKFAQTFPGKMTIVTTAKLDYLMPFLKRYRLTKLFQPEQLITAEAMAEHDLKTKPAPDGYELAMKFLGISQPKRLLVLEDSIVGVEAGVRSGATVLAVGTCNDHDHFYDKTVVHQPQLFAASFADIEIA